jgi:hypothetical protein
VSGKVGGKVGKERRQYRREFDLRYRKKLIRRYVFSLLLCPIILYFASRCKYVMSIGSAKSISSINIHEAFCAKMLNT